MDIKSKKSLSAAFWYIISNFISKALLYICTPLYTRLLTTSQYGAYNNFLSWQNILITLLTFDLSASVVLAYYDFEKDGEFDGFISTITLSSYCIPGILCSLILLFGDFFSRVFTIEKSYLILLALHITLNNTIQIFQAEQRVRLKYKLSAIITVGSATFTLLTTLLLVFLFSNKLTGILLGGILFNSIVSLGLAIRIFTRSHTFKIHYLKYAMSLAVPLIPHVLAGTILGSSDKVMITKFCGNEMTALYSLSFTISMIITMIASSINKAWVPWFYDRLRSNKIQQIQKVSCIIVCFIAVITFLICVLAPEILLIIGGKSYVISSIVMPPILLSCLINCISNFYINIEFYNKKTAGISIATVVSALINVALNYYFINRFGYVAAAYTTLISSITTLAFHIFKVKRQKMWFVYNNRFILIVAFSCIVFCEVLLTLYDLIIFRICILVLFSIFSMCFMLRYKSDISGVIKSFIKKGSNEQ